MIKILFQLEQNKLLVKKRTRLTNDQKNLINTNIISANELVFSDEYIKENIKIVNSFISELIKNNNLDTLVIKESEIAPLILKAISNITNIKNLYLLEESTLNFKTCEAIIKYTSIKYISLYNLPEYLLEMLDKDKIKVESRNEILFLSNFMTYNNLDTFSSLYYKNNINLNLPMNDNDYEDFNSFIKINKYLKKITVNTLNKNDLENILEILYKNRIKNINIYIKENIKDIELIEYLKKINKKNAKLNGIQFKILYDEKYLENNLISQLNINTIKACVYLTLVFISTVFIYIFSSNYLSMQKVEDIQSDINNIIAEYKEANKDKIEETPNDTLNNEDNNIDELENTDIPEKKEITNIEVEALLSKNPDTIGWLKVKDTNIDYPVVQTSDNDYYLTHNFNGDNDASGWVFMDYRADSINLSQNNIIFGHNMYYSGVMFGTLYKTKYSNWYGNEDNQIIEFDTLYGKMKWKIFSIYTTPVTNDYLIANFSSNKKFQNFLDLITERSIYTFNTPVSNEDKILTLTTCSNNGTKRLVIHAVLISEE